jgi:hypothetical protein
MKMPKNYAILTKGVVCDDCKAMDTTGDDWVVYADRDNVPLYSSADGGSPIGKAAFRQPFYAVEERGRYLHLVDYMQGNGQRKTQERSEGLWLVQKRRLGDVELRDSKRQKSHHQIAVSN